MELPRYLESIDKLRQHFQEQLSTAHERGEGFAELCRRLIPLTDMGRKFGEPQLSEKKTHDKGIDIVANRQNGDKLSVQAKFTIPDVKTLDSILSKFNNVYHTFSESDSRHKQLSLFDDDNKRPSEMFFMIVTSSKLDLILHRYKKTNMSSRAFFDELTEKNQLEIVDGTNLLSLIKGEYRKKYRVPVDIEVEFAHDIVPFNDVYLGVIGSSILKELYRVYGESLFFENIRDYLGDTSGLKSDTKDQAVNQKIIHTVRYEPERLLSRNNGLTFKAAAVTQISPNKLRLERASIVNGCQTTISVVNYADDECYVSAKIVRTDEAWDVTQAANYQNDVDRIDLELAPYFRHQLVERHAVYAGIGLNNVVELLDSIHRDQIDYDEMRSIFIGLFSDNPVNALRKNYTKLRFDLLEHVFNEDADGSELFEHLFAIQSKVEECMDYAAEKLQPSDRDEFRRFFISEITSYRAYISLLACSAVLQIDIAEQLYSTQEDFDAVYSFLREIRNIVEVDLDDLKRHFSYAVTAIVMAIQSTLKKDKSRQMHQFFQVNTFSQLLDQINRLKATYG